MLSNRDQRGIAARLCAVVIVSFMFGGCAISLGGWNTAHGTTVSLSENNFTVVRSNARGTDHVWRILGVIPIGDVDIRSGAMSILRRSANLEGGPRALVNVTDEIVRQHYIVATREEVIYTADVVEFR